MPPKKVDSTGRGQPPSSARESDHLGVEDLLLPRSIVQRLAKGVLPPNTQIQKDAVLAMSKSATVFINYISSQANEYAHAAQKKTIAPQHIFDALEELEFPDFIPRLKEELEKYNAIQSGKRNAAKNKNSQGGKSAIVNETKSPQSSATPNEDQSGGEGGRSVDDDEPAHKKVRFSEASAKNGAGDQSEEEDVDEAVEDEIEAEDDSGDDLDETTGLADEEEQVLAQQDPLAKLEGLDTQEQIEDPDEALSSGESD
ncbi:MAG: hypothetical protein M1814_002361 [Vezdaea aestivalis]|nr:MAG: hypothetical protein M1814_002361 [Vezdaea aestivalis]